MTFTKDKLPWKVGYSFQPEKGPLTNEQVHRLSEKHGFGVAKIRQLSREISSVLKTNLSVSQPQFRQGLRDRGVKELAASIKKLEKAVAEMEKASEAIEKINFSNPLIRMSGSNPASKQLENFSVGKARIEGFLRFLQIVVIGPI